VLESVRSLNDISAAHKEVFVVLGYRT
jgi:hypothetical protein